MAVESKVQSTLRLVFHEGEDLLTGDPIYKAKSFNNVKTDATADQLYAVATAFTGLQESPLYNIERKDSFDIREN